MARGFERPPIWAVIFMVVGAIAMLVMLPFASSRGTVPQDEVNRLNAEAAARIQAAEEAKPPSVVFIGDSWTYGVGATDNNGYAQLAVEQLGWPHAIFGVGGSGYTVTGAPGAGESASTFGDRARNLDGSTADIVVVQGSLNDRASPAADIGLAARQTFADLRAALSNPDAQILVVGSSYTPDSTREQIDRINSAIASAAEEAGLPFVNPAEENWTDPADDRVWFNGNHINDAGHRAVADQVVALLEAAAGQA